MHYSCTKPSTLHILQCNPLLHIHCSLYNNTIQYGTRLRLLSSIFRNFQTPFVHLLIPKFCLRPDLSISSSNFPLKTFPKFKFWRKSSKIPSPCLNPMKTQSSSKSWSLQSKKKIQSGLQTNTKRINTINFDLIQPQHMNHSSSSWPPELS